MMCFAENDITISLEGRRVLLVEDDFLVGLSLKLMLERMGCEVVGPYATAEEAILRIDTEGVDLAVLDINIVGGTSTPVATRLVETKRPFVFVTGYQSPRSLLPDWLHERRRLEKPVDEGSLRRCLEAALTDAA